MLQGILPVIPSLFDADNRIATNSIRRVVRFALDSGAHGIVFPGVASEYNFLSTAEREELIAAVADEVDGKVPILGGASASTAEEVVNAIAQVQKHGIRHVMIMAPQQLGQDTEAHLKFFESVVQNTSDVAVVLQNAPSPIGAGLSTAALSKIVAAVPAITYVKEETLPSGPTITDLVQNRVGHLKGVLGGGGARYLVDELNRGAIGALPAVELTDLHVQLFNSYRAGRHQYARDLYRASLPLLACQMVYRMRLTKYVLMRRGITSELHVRAPLPELDDFAKRDVDTMLQDLARTVDLQLPQNDRDCR